MRVLSENEVLQSEDLTREFVKTPEWANGDPDAGVFVKTVTGEARDKFEQESMKGKGKKTEFDTNNFRARIVALCACDDEGNAVFKNVAALGKKSAKVLERLSNVAMRLNGWSDKDVEELEKNYEAVQSEDSTSG